MRRTWKVSAIAAALTMAISAQAAGPKPDLKKISPLLVAKFAAKANEPVSAIVMLKQQAQLDATQSFASRSERTKYVYEKLSQLARDTQEGLVTWLTEKNVKHQRFYISNMVAVYNVDAETIAAISNRAEVEKIITNDLFKALPPVDKNGAKAQPALDGIEASLTSIGVDRVWALGVKGEGIVVAGQDTGVQWDHPALKSHYRGLSDAGVEHSYSWHDAIHESLDSGDNPCGIDIGVPCDDNQHGTHTMGTVVGDDGAANKIGVAPGAKWVACRNMERGVGRPTTYIECFEWFLAPYPKGADPMTAGKPELAPHVINNSWGCPPSEGCREAEILPVLEALQAAGIMVVASAGNDGPGCSTIKDPPAMHSAATLSVGAHNHRDGTIASFSSRGPSKHDGEVGPDITAPGVSIRSCVPGNGYSGAMWSGTSMAGPHVAGVVALIWSADPSLIGNIDKTTALLRRTATPVQSSQSCGGVPGTEIPNNTFGYGRVNALKVVQAVRPQP